MAHIPVLLKEAIEILNPQSGEFFIDGTLGGGGHAVAILEKISSNGIFLGIDWDGESLKRFELKVKSLKLKGKIILVNKNYADLPEILKEHNLPKADGLLIDLGFSSEQLEHSGRGFSFQKDEILDMRYQSKVKSQKSKVKSLSAAEVVNSFNEKDLADIFYKYGEERFSRRIAKKIVEERKKKRILTTFNLVEVIKRAVPKSYEKGRIHPATRVFQALRIYVNDELGNLEKLLKNIDKIIKNKPSSRPNTSLSRTLLEKHCLDSELQSVNSDALMRKADERSCARLTTGKGRIAIISFHSLEDRLVKNYFREMAKKRMVEILTNPEGIASRSYGARKPIRPSINEIQRNPRSRSAKMRVILLNH